MNGGTGGDVLIGGSGVNIASYEDSTDGVTVRLHVPTARGGDAQGDTFGRLITWTYTVNGQTMSVLVPDIIHLTGSDENDILAGDVRANTLRGGDGDDTLFGGPGGNETNDDRMYGDDGDDKLYGGRGDDRLYGGDDDDLLRGGAHNDTLEGGDGDDDLYGGDGNDVLEGGAGEDTLTGEAGNDGLHGGDDNDILSGGDGRDDLFGDEGDDRLDGGNDNDDLFGGDDDDTLIGGAGNDDLEGEDGDDVLEGGDGDDDLIGGFGEDIFKFSTGEGSDVIEDFTPGEDRIDLRSFSRINDMEDLDIVERGNSVEIDLPGSGELFLEDVFLSDLSEDDFIFSGDSDADDRDDDDDDDDDDDRDEPTVTGDPDDDRLHGSDRDDNFDGGGGDDVLYGGRGDDTLTGGDGVDSYEGGPGNDVIEVDYFDFTNGKEPPDQADRTMAEGVFDGGENDDGTQDSDTLSFAEFEDEDGDGEGVTVSLDSTNGVNYKGAPVTERKFINFENLIGSRYGDDLDGDSEPNVIEGGPGIDDLDGGVGPGDTVSYRHSPRGVTVTINSTASQGDASGDMLDGFENLIGSAYDDILTGDSDPNVIEGLAGADKLDGGGGTDTLSYTSSNAGVTIDLNEGDGNFDPGVSAIKTSSGGHAAGDNVKFQSFVNIIGSAHSDNLTGDNDDNKLEGRGGNDTLKGGEGNDTLDGGLGGDTLDGEDGDDTVTYEDATEGVTVDLSSVSVRNGVTTISNSSGRGEARGDRFIDVEEFVGSKHNDIFIAGPEADEADGGDGTDTISYERSRNAVLLTLPQGGGITTPQEGGNNHVNEEGKKENYAQGDVLNNFENIIGSNVSSTSTGYQDGTVLRHDDLTGNSGDNVIDGRGGNDTIDGSDGSDTLIGGRGNDTLTGGNGFDTFVYTSGSGDDTITDFSPTEDKLDLGTSSRSLNLYYKIDDSNLVITFGSHEITFSNNIGIADLGADNFEFNPDGYIRLTDNGTVGATKGNYKILGGAGDNRLTGGSKNDNINGGDGDDTINGGNGDDDIDGGNGDDIIEGGAGADEMDGGAGTDTLSYAGSPRGSTTGDDENPRTGVTVRLNEPPNVGDNTGTHADGDTSIIGFENLTGSSYNDMLTGNNTANVIKGGGGHDIIGGGGNDAELEGGSGRDRLDGDNTGAFLSYAGSSSRVTVDLSTTETVTLSDADQDLFGVTSVDNVIEVSGGDASGDIATGFANVIGSDRGGDTLTGDGVANELRGLGGSDTLTGNGGNDMLKGGEGNDTLRGGEGDDTLDGGPGRDTLEGGGTQGDEGDDIATYASAEEGVTVDLSGGNRGQGDAAGDTFTGIEEYVGSLHDDTFISGEDGDDIDGGGGSDTVSYERSEEAVTVNLSTGDTETTVGSYANGDSFTSIENVIGSSKADNLTAGSNGSVIEGGEGDDDLTGDSGGSDTFVFASGDGEDEVTGFTPGSEGNYDRIDLSAFSSIASMDDLEGEITLLSNDTDTDIDLPNNGEITLRGVTPEQLTPDNFIFTTYPKTVPAAATSWRATSTTTP